MRNDKIVKARKKAGISQLELANLINVTQSEISLLENGRRTLTVECAKKIGIALNCEWVTFFEDRNKAVINK